MIDNQALLRRRPVIRLFVSSTFTDLKHERDALQRDVFLKLEEHCATRQFQFQAIDLRWGVPTEASLDHRTMRICFEELRRSQEISPQPNFLILLGDRYGWRPLPEEISEEEFGRLEREALSKEAKKVLSDWYQRDDNAIPPVYILQSRKQDLKDSNDYTNDDVWKEIQRILWDIINRAYPAQQLAGRFANPATQDMPLPSIVRFQASATEQEIWRGALGAPNADQHVLAFVRRIENLHDRKEFPNVAEMKDFVDVDAGAINAVSQGALNDLKVELERQLAGGHPIMTATARLKWVEGEKGGTRVDVTTEHLAAMCDEIYSKLKAIIDRQINEYWTTEELEIPTVRQLELECNEHQRFGQERAPLESFVGRERHLAAIRDYVENESHGPLVIHGASGCGKTALLARASQEVATERKPIVRFVGVTPHSSDTRALLSSICQELRQRHPLEQPLPSEYTGLSQELLQHFNSATDQEPMILFLDALDQLADSDDGRSLHWLPTDLLPPHVKLVVSCLSDRTGDDPVGRPFAALKELGLTGENSIDLDALSEKDANELLFKRWLPQVWRKLTAEQTERIRERLTTDRCRAPLYLKILFEEARLWRSTEPVPALGESVPALLGNLLDRLGQPGNHGITAERTLGYIASARRGLSELEILEVLYCDHEYKQFLDSVAKKTGHTLPDEPPRIPIAIWSRLRFDLAPYLAEHAAPGANVLNFYHRQVADIVRAKFLDSDDKRRAFHLALGSYFEPKALTPRKVDELPWQLSESADWQRLNDFLAEPEFFKTCWEQNQFDTRSYWVSIEASSALRMTDAYQALIAHPEQEPDKRFLWHVGILLYDSGHPEEALAIRSVLSEHFKTSGDQDNYQASLGNQANILYSRGDLDGAMALLKEKERICRQLGNLDSLSASLGNQALILYSRGDLDGAMALLKEKERICRQLGNLDSLQRSLGGQALILYSRGDLDGAMTLQKEVERICRQLGNLEGLQASLGNQANILDSRGDLDGAMALLKEVERICRQLGNLDSLSASLGNQALILKLRGDLDGAMALHKEGERICRQLGNLDSLSASLGNQANILYSRGDLDGAMALHKEEERICRQLGNLDSLSASLGNQANILYSRGDLDGAMALLKEKERICRQLGNLDSLQRSLGGQALILDSRGDLDGAMTLHKEVERICRQLGNLDSLQGSLGNQALILKLRGDLDGAMTLHKEVERICRQLGNLEGLQASLGNQANILDSRGDLDGAMALHKEGERICRQLGNVEGLATSLTNQALLLAETGRLTDGLQKVVEAYQLCSAHGYAALVQQIEPILTAIRRAAQGS